MGVHDVIVECERLSLEFSERCPHDTCHFATSFRSRSGTTNSATFGKQTIFMIRRIFKETGTYIIIFYLNLL